MKRDLVILGTTVHGAEMAQIVARINAVTPTWDLLGFVVSAARLDKTPTTYAGHPVLGPQAVLSHMPEACAVPAFGYDDPLDALASELVSLIDPSVFVSETAQIGRGCVVFPGCFIGLNATLGDRVFALSGCVINHDNRIEDEVTFASAVSLAGGVQVESHCYLGQACTVRQSVRIGAGSLIGMGAVVLENVPANSVMVGNPARRLRDNSQRILPVRR